MNKPTTALILCGGDSLRMGFDKKDLKLKGQSHLGEILNYLEPHFDQLLISLRQPLKTPLDTAVVHDIVLDELPARGPLSGIHAGLKASLSDYVFVTACDLAMDPDYLAEFLNRLEGLEDCQAIVHEKADGMEPFFAVYHKSLIPQIEQAVNEGRKSLTALVRASHHIALPIPANYATAFYNFNEPLDVLAFEDPDFHYDSPLIAQADIRRFKGRISKDIPDEVIREVSLQIELNGTVCKTMDCSPQDLEDLVYGHLFTQGLIDSPEAVTSLEIVPLNEFEILAKVRATLHAAEPVFEERKSAYQVNLSRVYELVSEFTEASQVFKRTGGSHGAGLIGQGKMLAFREDVGRHNALDKLIGWGLRQHLDFTQVAVLLSGRLAREMTQKVLRTKAPVLLSKSCATDHSIHLAKTYGLTLVGFIRGERANLYHLNPKHQVV